MSESLASLQSDNVTPPRSSATPGAGITVIATSTTASSTDLWDKSDKPYVNVGYFERYVSIMATGGDVWISFSEAAVTISEAATGTTTTTCWLLKDGVERPYRLSVQDRFLNLKAVTGTPTVRLTPSSQPAPFNRQLP